MDSLTQIALGSAVGVAVMGRRTRLWKAALWGGICGTLPDLDSFIDHGDAIRNVTYHRAESHALIYLTLAAPLIAWVAARLHGELDRFRRWWLAVWLALVTHPLLDVMTIYGTQLALPFTDRPFGVGSIFIIDPLYTLPLLVGLAGAAALRGERGRRWNAAGLVLANAYLAWSVLAQQHVYGVVNESLEAQGIRAERVLATPTAFNTVLWRIVVIEGEHYYEGFYSLLDTDRRIDLDRFPRNLALYERLRDDWHVARVAWFSRGFFAMSGRGDQVLISDLRMGQEPFYTFTFAVAECLDGRLVRRLPERLPRNLDVGPILRWMAHRLRGERMAPPRGPRRHALPQGHTASGPGEGG